MKKHVLNDSSQYSPYIEISKLEWKKFNSASDDRMLVQRGTTGYKFLKENVIYWVATYDSDEEELTPEKLEVYEIFYFNAYLIRRGDLFYVYAGSDEEYLEQHEAQLYRLIEDGLDLIAAMDFFTL